MRNLLDKQSNPTTRKVIIMLISIMIIYFVAIGVTKIKGNPGFSKASKMDEMTETDFYYLYLVDRKYNPDTEEMIVKIFVQKKMGADVYTDLNSKQIETFASNSKGETNLHPKVLVPTKNLMVVQLSNVKKSELKINLDIKIKKDVIKHSSDRQTESTASYVLDVPSTSYDKQLSLESKKDYTLESTKYYQRFSEKEIKRVEKQIQKLKIEKREIQNQLDYLDEQKIKSDEKKLDGINNQMSEYQKTLDDKQKDIDKKVEKINSIHEDMRIMAR